MDAASFAAGYEQGRANGRGPVVIVGGSVGPRAWSGATITAAIAAAGANIATGDMLNVAGVPYYVHVDGQGYAHAIPLAYPVSTTVATGSASPVVLTAWHGVDPTDIDGEGTALAGWAKVGDGLSVTDGVVTLADADGSSRTYLTYTPASRPTGPTVLILYGVEAVATSGTASQRPQWQLRSGDSDRYVRAYPEGTPSTSRWAMVPGSGAVTETVTGSQVGTPIDRWVSYADTSSSSTPIRGEIGLGWEAWSQSLATVSSTIGVFLDSGRLSSGQSLSISGVLLAELHS